MTGDRILPMSGEPTAAPNPFSTLDTAPPFAGRTEHLARLHQHLTSAAVPHALTLLGRRRSGRTAFLAAARRKFDETFVWATPDISSIPDESTLLRALYQSGKDAASARGLSVHRLPRWPDEQSPAEQRAWLAETGLPELYQLIRPTRRLIWVVDGVEPLAEAVARGTLPADFGAWLAMLFGQQLGMLLTAHLDQETTLERLAPLVDAAATLRLGPLSEEEVSELLVFGRDTPEPGFAKQLHALTGGLPELTLRAAEAVHTLSRGEAYSTAHLKQVRGDLATGAAAYFRSLWGNLSANEQAVLTATAYLHLNRPDTPTTAENIERWLADSDYPLDLTDIFAVLRRLEFVDIVSGTHAAITIRAGLFELWILDTVRPEHLRRMTPDMSRTPVDSQLTRYIVIGLVIALIILVVIALSSQSAPNADTIVPTVTLGS